MVQSEKKSFSSTCYRQVQTSIIDCATPKFVMECCDVLFLVFATLKVQVVIQEYYIESVEELEGQMKLHQIRRIDAAAA